METLLKAESSPFDYVPYFLMHFSEPWLPPVPGIEEFEGQTVHSHAYRKPEPFAGRHVVIWGASASACDIAQEVANAGADSVTVCHRPTPWFPSGFPPSIKFSANIVSANKEGFNLADGTICKADTLIYCTGYNYSFPFLSPECKIRVDDNHVTPLYKHLINREHPTMCLVGLPQMAVPFIMFNFQVQYFLKVLEGSVVLPTIDEMLTEEVAGREGGPGDKRKMHHLIQRQWAYFEALATSACLKKLPPVVERMVTDSIVTMLHDVANFKKYRYTVVDSETFTKVRVL